MKNPSAKNAKKEDFKKTCLEKNSHIKEKTKYVLYVFLLLFIFFLQQQKINNNQIILYSYKISLKKRKKKYKLVMTCLMLYRSVSS